ncbi:MAG: uncharacterized protein KVP18_003174 [Porospora cf. gigantea A]|uniref:uncharacterized protein n=1 Tax=Porospora cf. gigantea A TaxID=2853593 RepID=UPI00355A5EB7|nr:MAG: hypothetical protein KVP18_003174 [Porospora cf. gigantea A]
MLSVALVSDFFLPHRGGVEYHVFNLARCLQTRGLNVIVITSRYKEFVGVRQSEGVKTYYLPYLKMVGNMCICPTAVGCIPVLRRILLEEKINIVHAHQATSSLGHEATILAQTMGLSTVYTDHSLFGFTSVADIHINKVLSMFLPQCAHVICVSHTNKENLLLRAGVMPSRVSVIPNALVSDDFQPDPSRRHSDRVVIVTVSRLFFRKGIDLLMEVVPAVCAWNPSVEFLIGGDGPKRMELEAMIEECNLHGRVTLLGSLAPYEVRAALCRGHIYLNPSLTEAFCIAILEAASCGMLVVSTNVGGVSEVLPPDMIHLCPPNVHNLVHTLQQAILSVDSQPDPWETHRRVAALGYNWERVAEKTVAVYKQLAPPQPLLERLTLAHGTGGGLNVWAHTLLLVLLHVVVVVLDLTGL